MYTGTTSNYTVCTSGHPYIFNVPYPVKPYMYLLLYCTCTATAVPPVVYKITVHVLVKQLPTPFTPVENLSVPVRRPSCPFPCPPLFYNSPRTPNRAKPQRPRRCRRGAALSPLGKCLRPHNLKSPPRVLCCETPNFSTPNTRCVGR